MKENVNYLIDRLTSEKFWEGVAIILTGVGVYLNPEAAVQIAGAGAVIYGAVRVVSNNWSKLFRKDVPEPTEPTEPIEEVEV